MMIKALHCQARGQWELLNLSLSRALSRSDGDGQVEDRTTSDGRTRMFSTTSFFAIPASELRSFLEQAIEKILTCCQIAIHCGLNAIWGWTILSGQRSTGQGRGSDKGYQTYLRAPKEAIRDASFRKVTARLSTVTAEVYIPRGRVVAMSYTCEPEQRWTQVSG